MSLVGSLEDLTLGDILQIVSLARKSGLLVVRSEQGDGRICFTDGMVRAAWVKGEPEDLRGLLLAGSFATPDELDRVQQRVDQDGTSPDEAVTEVIGIAAERLQSLRRERVERSVLEMFRWTAGEFSFDVFADRDAMDEPLALPVGLNAQYLTMEATRLGDEVGSEAAPSDIVLSGELEAAAEPASDPIEHLAVATAAAEDAPTDSVSAESEAEPVVTEDPPLESAAEIPLVAIDRDLRALEWLKRELGDLFTRVHIFQHCEGGVGRIRQYLGRGEIPAVLVSATVPADSTTGVADVNELVRRLRAQAPRMPILLMHEGDDGESSGAAADAVVARPPTVSLTDRRLRLENQARAAELRAIAGAWARVASRSGSELDRIRELCERLRDPVQRPDVLQLVVEVAGETWRRVALFALPGDDAVGIAERGLDRAGGPDAAGIRQVRVPLAGSELLRAAIEQRLPVQGAPASEADRALCRALGASVPETVHVSPVVCGGAVAGLLYADNLPEDEPLDRGDVLAIVLAEAGRALDAEVFERLGRSGSEQGS